MTTASKNVNIIIASGKHYRAVFLFVGTRVFRNVSGWWKHCGASAFLCRNAQGTPPTYSYFCTEMIDQATIDRVLDAAQIVDVVSDFVTLRKRGVNYIGLCPFHDERTPSFSVSPSKGICKCFSCGKGGNAVHFIMEHEQLSYHSAIKWLAKKYHIEIKERELTDEEKQAQNLRESLLVVNQFASQYFQDILHTHEEGKQIGLNYFRSRGFRDDIIKKFQLGYSLNKPADLAKTAVSKGYQSDFLVKTGLCYTKDDGSLHDRFWGRVIFPVHSVSGNVVAFGGRVLNTATKNVQMKYVNSPESEIYHKSRELYGIFFAKQSIVKQDRCFLVEGYTDVISMHQSGIENVVSSSGTALTSEQIRLIHRFTNNITLLYDGDPAGIKASIRGIDMLLEEGMNVKVCLLPDGDDPDSFARKHNATEYQAYINEHEVDFITFKTNLLLEEAGRDPIKRASLISGIVKSISVIPDSIVRSVYIRECSRLLEIEEKILVQSVADNIKAALENKEKERTRKAEREARKAETSSLARPTDTPPPAEDFPAQPLPLDDTFLPPPPVDESIVPLPSPEFVPEPALIDADDDRATLFYRIEKEIMRIVFRYGEKEVLTVEDEDGNAIAYNAIEYISGCLSQDDLSLYVPLFRRVLEEAEQNCHTPSFMAERYFLSHPDSEISRLAAALVSDRYELSKYHTKFQKVLTDEERLPELIERIMVDFKLLFVKTELHRKNNELLRPEVIADIEKVSELLAQIKDLQQTYQMLAKQAGERVVETL